MDLWIVLHLENPLLQRTEQLIVMLSIFNIK